MNLQSGNSSITTGLVSPAGPGRVRVGTINVIVFTEPGCLACERVLAVAEHLRRAGALDSLTVTDRASDNSSCNEYRVLVFPSTYVNGRLVFHGEFSTEEFLRLYGENDEMMNMRIG